MDIQELVTVLTYRINNSKIKEYDRQLDRLARKSAKLFGSGKETGEKKSIQDVARLKERLIEYELRLRVRLAQRERKLIEDNLNYEMKLRYRIARLKERLAEQEANKARRTQERERNRELREAEKNRTMAERAGMVGGTLGTYIFGRAIKETAFTAGDIEAQLNIIRGLSGATDKQMDTLKQTMVLMSQTTKFKPMEVLGGMTELARAGFKPKDINTLTPNILNFATASQTTFDQATMMVTDMLFSFGMKVKESGKVADILSAGMNESKLDFVDLRDSLKYVAGSANAAGMNLQQTMSLMAILAQLGFRGETGGTSGRKIITNSSLAGSSLKGRRQKKTLDMLGIQAFDPKTDRMDILKVLGQLGKKIKDKKRQERITIANRLFGLTAQSQALAIMNSLVKMPEEAARITKKVEKEFAGTTKRVSDIINQGFLFQFGRMQSSVTLLSNSIGTELNPLLGFLADKIKDVTNWYTDLNPKVHKLTGLFGIGAFAILAYTAALTGIAIAFPVLKSLNAWLVANNFQMGLWLAYPLLIAAGIALIVFAAQDFYSYMKGDTSVLGYLIENYIIKPYKDAFGIDLPAKWAKLKKIAHDFNSTTGTKFNEMINTIRSGFYNLFSGLAPYFTRYILNPIKSVINWINTNLDLLWPGLGGKKLILTPNSMITPGNNPASGTPMMLKSAKNSGGTNINIPGITQSYYFGGTNATASEVGKQAKQGTQDGLRYMLGKTAQNYSAGY